MTLALGVTAASSGGGAESGEGEGVSCEISPPFTGLRSNSPITECLFARAGRSPSSFRPMAVPLDKRLVFVTGKGGVGKTTVATALGLVAAGRGKRTIVCEIGGQGRLASLFGLPALGHREHELAPGLSGISIDPEQSKEEWLRYELRSSTLAGLLGHSRLFQYLTAAAPG